MTNTAVPAKASYYNGPSTTRGSVPVEITGRFITSEVDSTMLWTAVGTLLVLPIYKISKANDFIMRGSMAPAFMIGLYVVMYVTDNFEMCRDNKLELKKALAGMARRK